MIVRWLSVVLAVAAFAGCSRSAPPISHPRYETVERVPHQLKAEFEAFASALEGHLRRGETNEAFVAFDRAAVAEEVCEGLKASPLRLRQFKQGLEKGFETGVRSIVATWCGQEVTFKRLVLYKGRPAARFRLATDETGVAIVDFVLLKAKAGTVRIGNFYNQTVGYDLVEQTRVSSAPVLAELDRGFIGRLLGQQNMSREDMRHFQDLSRKTVTGDFAGAIAAYNGLPAVLQDTMTATVQHLLALQRSGDNEAYRQALKKAGARYPTGNFQFMLVDAWYLEGDFDKAVACLDAFVAAVEPDAALSAMKSLLLNAKGDTRAALVELRKAMQMEPDCIYVRAKGLDVLLAAKDWDGVSEAMRFLEANADYSFKGNLTDPAWKEFKKTPQAKPWL